MKLSKKRTKKALIRLHRCAGWSAPVLFATLKDRFSRNEAHMYHFQTCWFQIVHVFNVCLSGAQLFNHVTKKKISMSSATNKGKNVEKERFYNCPGTNKWALCAFRTNISLDPKNRSKYVPYFAETIWAATQQNLFSGFQTKRVSNQSPQLQRLARKLKF